MTDKGFNIADDCASRCIIELIIPPGKRGLANEVPISVIPQLDDIVIVLVI